MTGAPTHPQPTDTHAPTLSAWDQHPIPLPNPPFGEAPTRFSVSLWGATTCVHVPPSLTASSEGRTGPMQPHGLCCLHGLCAAGTGASGACEATCSSRRAAEPGRRRRVRGRGLRSLGPREWVCCPSDPGLLRPPHLVVSCWLPDSSWARAEALRPVAALWAPYSRDTAQVSQDSPWGLGSSRGPAGPGRPRCPTKPAAGGGGGRSRPGLGASPGCGREAFPMTHTQGIP